VRTPAEWHCMPPGGRLRRAGCRPSKLQAANESGGSPNKKWCGVSPPDLIYCTGRILIHPSRNFTTQSRLFIADQVATFKIAQITARERYRLGGRALYHPAGVGWRKAAHHVSKSLSEGDLLKRLTEAQSKSCSKKAERATLLRRDFSL
jgi:hypothetical protein